MRGVSILASLGLSVLAFGAGGGPAMSQEASEDLLQADEGTFASTDLNSDGKIARREVIHFVDLVFLSIDADGDETVTLEEFKAWDTGYLHAATAMDKTDAFDQAKEEVYQELDLNEDGTVEHDEMSAAALYYFYTADVDKSRFLDQEEFTQEFAVLKNLRAPLE
jgi:Ca2+-binding EF-hand superfamily protein